MESELKLNSIRTGDKKSDKQPKQNIKDYEILQIAKGGY